MTATSSIRSPPRFGRSTHGKLTAYKGNYSKYRHLKAERERRQQTEYVRQQHFHHKAGGTSSSGTARDSAHARRSAGKKRLNRMERIEAVRNDKDDHSGNGERDADRSSSPLDAGARSRLSRGRQAGQASGYRGTWRSKRHSRTAIHRGPNGMGKTTFLHTILGYEPPLGGSAALGHNVKVGFQRQGTYDLPEHRSVLDAIIDVKNLSPEDARTYLGRFPVRRRRRVQDRFGFERR